MFLRFSADVQRWVISKTVKDPEIKVKNIVNDPQKTHFKISFLLKFLFLSEESKENMRLLIIDWIILMICRIVSSIQYDFIPMVANYWFIPGTA